MAHEGKAPAARFASITDAASLTKVLEETPDLLNKPLSQVKNSFQRDVPVLQAGTRLLQVPSTALEGAAHQYHTDVAKLWSLPVSARTPS